MSNNTIISFCIVMFYCLFTQTTFGQKNNIHVDFGSDESSAPWNNILNPQNGSLTNLATTEGVLTNISIAINDAFNGINTAGTTIPNSALGIPPSASSDSFFGNEITFSGKIEPTGGFILENLNETIPYDLSFFASREATDNRETQYIIIGASRDTLLLQVASNTSIVVETTVFPDTNGTISVIASAGPNNNNSNRFFYLGSMMISYDKAPDYIELLYPDGGEYLQSGSITTIEWQSNATINIGISYSINDGETWMLIDSTPANTQQYQWVIPDVSSSKCIVKLQNSQLLALSTTNFTISNQESEKCTIVIIGSSTAAGTGASPHSNSWAEKYKKELQQINSNFEVINLAKGGYTTYHLVPDGTNIPINLGIEIDNNRNITAALSHSPYAIIVNLPSNDAARNIDVNEQMINFNLMKKSADSLGVLTYICTTQPRNFNNSSQIQIQYETKDSILSTFGDYSIDVWNGLADQNGHILPQYNSGDGVHLNNAGHQFFFDQVAEKRIDTFACNTILNYTDLIEKLDFEFNIYPNPTQGTFTIHFNSDIQAEIFIDYYDILGVKILPSQSYEGTSFSIPQNTSVKGIVHCIVRASNNKGDYLFRKTLIIN